MRRLLAALVLALLPASACAQGCTGSVCNFDTLGALGAKLGEARSERGGKHVHILQIGDSHTAGDVFTGALRDLLHADFGSGGRGILPPGRPYPGYRTRGVRVTMSDGWDIGATFGPGAPATRAPLGLSSVAATATRAGASMSLIAEPQMAIMRFVLCAMAGPGAGGITVRFDGETRQRFDFAARTVAPRCETLIAEYPHLEVEIVADGLVTITSWATFRDDGVALSNLGISGSQLMHFARTDDSVIGEELRAYAPDLIVLAFGTNEGFGPGIDAAAYEAVLRSQIERFRFLAPGVPILLLGPPDALSRRPALRGTARDCPARKGIQPLFAPPGLAQVRAVQRRVADIYHVAWWDWQARMGGLCSAQAWVNAAPPRMADDYVHFRDAGGKILADALLADLIRAGEAQ